MTDIDEISRRKPHYRPIEDYGIIGNLCSVALVRLDGSIDWCCLPNLDSPSVFGALLDAKKGGYFMVRPSSYTQSSQEYIEGTNILKTIFRVGGGRIEVCDFMPTGPSVELQDEAPEHLEIYRRIRCTHGRVELDVVWAPRHDYARNTTRIEPTGQGYMAVGSDRYIALGGLREGRIIDLGDGPAVAGRISLRQGEETTLLTRWDDVVTEVDPERASRKFEETRRAWLDWATKSETGLERPWAGRFEAEVLRSELVLKLMTRRSGALAAAATTSLPETIHGVRNWDYRFTWIRDAAQIAQALYAVNHADEARAFIKWAEYMACDNREFLDEGLKIIYPLTPGTELTEETLDHLSGYRHSAPVRIGNGAAGQLQLCVFGELLDAVYEKVRLGEEFESDMSDFLKHVADEACRAWHHPDFGIWELKNGPLHNVYSKMMTWVALDRACWLAERGHLDGHIERWKKTMAKMRAQILEYGYNDEIDSFVLSFHGDELDAANLLMPMMEFLPADDPRMQNTIDRTLERLTVEDLVYRYMADDGLPGDEGAFALCTCWLVDALALSYRLDEANRIFENLIDRTNHLGLVSEQIDPASGEFLGNFPQAYSHLGIINSALYLGQREGRELPIESLVGTDTTTSRSRDR